ncbi:hypothetical protein MHYP_G00152930 [Metynnis hypsauchen]
MSVERSEERHRAVTGIFVKGLQPFSTVVSPWLRERTEAPVQRYAVKNADIYLISACYCVKKSGLSLKIWTRTTSRSLHLCCVPALPPKPLLAKEAAVHGQVSNHSNLHSAQMFDS